MRDIRCVLGIGLLLQLAACSGDEPPAGASNRSEVSGSAKLSDRAKILDQEGLDALRQVRPGEEESSVYVFSESSPMLDALEAGDVLIIGPSSVTPAGRLIEVSSIDPQDGEVLLEGRPAALADAFEELRVALTATLNEPASMTTAELEQGLSRTQQALGLSFPIALREGSGANRIALEGSLALDSSIDLELDFDFTEFALKELSLRFSGEETFFAELTGRGRASIAESVELGSIAFTPITLVLPVPFPPGTLPVVLTPQVVLEAGVMGAVEGEVSTSVRQEASFTAGLGYRDGFEAFSDSDSEFAAEPPSYAAAVNARAWAGPRLEVLLYGAVGPFARAEAFVELAASVQAPPPCVTGVLDAGLRGTIGVDFLAEYETTLFDTRYPLGTYDSCDDDPDAARPVSTWARSYGREGSPSETAKAVVEAADGSLLVVGDSNLFDGITGFAASTWVLRLDALGNVIWDRAFERALGLTRAAAALADGFLVAGTSGVMKLDSGGNVVWAQSYDDEELIDITSLAAQPDGSFAVAGYHGTDAQAWAMGLDARGKVRWSNRYPGEPFTRLRTTADGGYIVVGEIDGDVNLVKLDRDGEIEFARALDNAFDASPDEPGGTLAHSGDRAYDVAEKPNGGYVIAAESYGPFPLPEPTPVGYYATWIIEVDAEGELAEGGSTVHRAPIEAQYGGAYAVGVWPNGTSLVLGRRADTSGDLLMDEGVLVIQGGSYSVLDGAGNDAADGGTLSGAGHGMPLAMTADGGAIVAATSNSFGGQEQFWLVKLNRAGSIDFPYRQSVPGRSFVNPDATSSNLTGIRPEPVDIRAAALSDVRHETTGVTIHRQTP